MPLHPARKGTAGKAGRKWQPNATPAQRGEQHCPPRPLSVPTPITGTPGAMREAAPLAGAGAAMPLLLGCLCPRPHPRQEPPQLPALHPAGGALQFVATPISSSLGTFLFNLMSLFFFFFW